MGNLDPASNPTKPSKLSAGVVLSPMHNRRGNYQLRRLIQDKLETPVLSQEFIQSIKDIAVIKKY